jgi:phosphatidylglycerophosphatase A
MNKSIIRLLATFFGTGNIPFIHGTWGSLAGLLVYILFLRQNIILHLLILAMIIAFGFAVSSRAEEIFQKKDASQIVIDEVAGMLLTLLFVPAKTIYIIFGFFLFRLFDTLKVAPTDSLENLPGSAGVMTDDLVAAIYANLCLQILNIILPFFNLSV